MFMKKLGSAAGESQKSQEPHDADHGPGPEQLRRQHANRRHPILPQGRNRSQPHAATQQRAKQHGHRHGQTVMPLPGWSQGVGHHHDHEGVGQNLPHTTEKNTATSPDQSHEWELLPGSASCQRFGF